MMKNINSFKLSEHSVNFIRRYVIPFLHIDHSLDAKTMCDIEDILYEWEDELYTNDGGKRAENFPEKERAESAANTLQEILSIWEKGEIDYQDLNARLEFRQI